MDDIRADEHETPEGLGVTSLASLFHDAVLFDGPRIAPGLDPFGGGNRLVEAALIEVRIDVSAATLGLLLDVRGIAGNDLVDWGLLVAPGVTRFSVELTRAPQPRYARIVVRSVVRSRNGQFELELDTWADGSVSLTAPMLCFFWLDLSSMELDHPDYDEDEAVIRGFFPSWNAKSVRILGASRT
jgi:hypothetical protein